MHLIKFFSLCLVTAAMVLGAFSFARGSAQEGDLLDPSLDRPLPQYQSTNLQGFEQVPMVSLPDLTKSASQDKNVSLPAQTSVPGPASNRGTELAPNPLQSLLSGKEPQQQASPSDVLVEESQPAPKVKLKERASIIETKRAEQPEKLKSPAYHSPFNPKPLGAQNSLGTQNSFGILTAPEKLAPPSVKPSAKKTEPKQTKAKKKTKAKATAAPRKPTLNYNIYRDQSAYPIDPRKPNNPCTQAHNCGCAGCLAGRAGAYGRPHQPREPGGYACGKNCPNKRPQFSVYWPRPFSAKRDERDPESAAARYQGCQPKRLIDGFDRLVNFRLIDYQRTDNGYCGPGSDPYGCLGESKVVNANLGYQMQTQPVVQAAYPLR